MALGQQSGPPASARLVQRLIELVIQAGHTDLRDARHPLGLTQRQAGGKFTISEAQGLIDQLEAQLEAPQFQEVNAEAQPATDTPDTGAAEASRAAQTPSNSASTQPSQTQRPQPVADSRDERRRAALRKIPDYLLAGELQRRGWIVMEP